MPQGCGAPGMTMMGTVISGNFWFPCPGDGCFAPTCRSSGALAHPALICRFAGCSGSLQAKFLRHGGHREPCCFCTSKRCTIVAGALLSLFAADEVPDERRLPHAADLDSLCLVMHSDRLGTGCRARGQPRTDDGRFCQSDHFVLRNLPAMGIGDADLVRSMPQISPWRRA